MRLLIAEDDQITRRLVTSTFSHAFDITEVDDGALAAHYLSEAHAAGEPYDIVIFDLELPNMSGLEALAVLRALEESRVKTKRKATKVIVLTAHTEAECIYDAHALSCDVYLVKPVDIKKLQAEIRRLIEELNSEEKKGIIA